MTTELIPVFPADIGNSPVNAIDARKLHEFLEVRSEFRNWIKNRITDYGFVQDIDYIAGNFLPGSDRVDYHCTISMGKELAMVERNAKGKQARQYFIECERRLLESTLQIPRSFADALQLAADQARKIEVMAPKADYYDRLMGTHETVDLETAAKALRTSRPRLIAFLKDRGILTQKCLPTQYYIDRDYLRIQITPFEDQYGVKRLSEKTVITQAGLLYIRGKLDTLEREKAIAKEAA